MFCKQTKNGWKMVVGGAAPETLCGYIIKHKKSCKGKKFWMRQ